MPLRSSGWILVGGQSRRMGTDKALLTVDELPLALHAAHLLKPFTNKIGLIGDPAKYATLGFDVVPDRRPNCGPLAGIEAALLATDSVWTAILACDLPAVDHETLAALIELSTFEQSVSKPSGNETIADAIVPKHPDGKLEPLCALYKRSALPFIQAALDNGTRRVTDALATLTVRYLPVADARPFCNLNTPDDVHRYLHG